MSAEARALGELPAHLRDGPVGYAEEDHLGGDGLAEGLPMADDGDVEPGRSGGGGDRTADTAVADHGKAAQRGRRVGRCRLFSVPF